MVREFEKPSSPFELEQSSRRRWQGGTCLHPLASIDACSGSAIQSHTVQRQGGLAKIADPTNHVLTTKVNFDAMAKSGGNPDPMRIGVRKASTFPGLCAKHDGEFFGAIEGASLAMNADTAFRFAFRSVCLEHFNKLKALEGIDDLRRKADAGQSPRQQMITQAYLRAAIMGLQRGLEESTATKDIYDAAFHSGTYLTDTHFSAVWFDGVLPIAASFALQPEFDFSGKKLQSLMNFTENLEHVTVNITAFGDRTVAIFAWLGKPDGCVRAFVDSYFSLPKDQMANALVSGCFELAENIYFSPLWWDQLPSARRTLLKKKAKNGTPAASRSCQGLLTDGYSYTSARAESVCGLHNWN